MGKQLGRSGQTTDKHAHIMANGIIMNMTINASIIPAIMAIMPLAKTAQTGKRPATAAVVRNTTENSKHIDSGKKKSVQGAHNIMIAMSSKIVIKPRMNNGHAIMIPHKKKLKNARTIPNTIAKIPTNNIMSKDIIIRMKNERQ